MQCPRCQHANRDTAKFCEACGGRLIHRCVHCGHDRSPQAKFCEECSTPLMAPASVPGSVHSMQQEADSESRFHELILTVMGLLQRERRITYRRLKHVYRLDEALLEDVKEELLFTGIACDEDGKGLGWIGETPPLSTRSGNST